MFTALKNVLPDPLKQGIKKIWHQIRPPRIRITRFIETGCVFEVTNDLEKYRVASYGEEAETVEIILSEIMPNDVFYDIGSCLGLYALHAALLNCKVVAFEPDPTYRKRLKRNIKINGCQKKVQIIDWAVSDQIGSATLFTDGLEGKSPSLREVGRRGSATVNTNTIDNAISEGEIPPPDIIKMDIEGAESLALRGMTGLLSSEFQPRILFVEFHPDFLPNFNSSIEECIQLLHSYGYKEIYSLKRTNQSHHFFRVDTYETKESISVGIA